mmetsp:Transcript_150/g.220  ORF Transcript_150/g.220 Transcript_150/m.220 type:complete len:319 (-) Transcript_150:40-996(-)
MNNRIDAPATAARKSQRLQAKAQKRRRVSVDDAQQQRYQDRADAQQQQGQQMPPPEQEEAQQQEQGQQQREPQQQQQPPQQNQQESDNEVEEEEEEFERIPRYSQQQQQQRYQQQQYGYGGYDGYEHESEMSMARSHVPMKPGTNILKRVANGHYGYIREQVQGMKAYGAYRMVPKPLQAAVDFGQHGIQLMCVVEMIHVRAAYLGVNAKGGLLKELLQSLDMMAASWTICERTNMTASVMRSAACAARVSGAVTLPEQLSRMGLDGIITANINNALNPKKQTKNDICHSFAKDGTCRFGARCRFKHVKKDEEEKKVE